VAVPQPLPARGAALEPLVSVCQRRGWLTDEADGTGESASPTAAIKGAGLTNMIDRVGAAGGSLEVQSVPGAGTMIRGMLPIELDKVRKS